MVSRSSAARARIASTIAPKPADVPPLAAAFAAFDLPSRAANFHRHFFRAPSTARSAAAASRSPPITSVRPALVSRRNASLSDTDADLSSPKLSGRIASWLCTVSAPSEEPGAAASSRSEEDFVGFSSAA